MSTRANIFSARGKDIKKLGREKGMLFSKDEKKRSMSKSSWIVGALAFVGAAGIVNKGRRLVKNACCKVREMMHKDVE